MSSPGQSTFDNAINRGPGAAPAHGFTPDVLSCALVLTGTATPTVAQLAGAVRELYPTGGGPTVGELLAGGWLVSTVDGKRLREPPVPVAELSGWLASAFSGMSNSLVGGVLKTLQGGITATNEEPTAAAPDSPPAGNINAVTAHLVSYFTGPITNTTPRAAITVGTLHGVIVAPPRALRERAGAARHEYQANGKTSRYKELKCSLDYFTAGGTFSRRADAALVAESGLLTLDFDELGGRVGEARDQLLADTALAPALALVFVSPSGDGLKAVLAGDPRYSRATNYERLARHLARRYGWGPTLDAKTADVSRACFLSHDPTAWLAPGYSSLLPPR